MTTLARAAEADATQRGEGWGITAAEWATAVLGNGLGHYDRALAAAQRAVAYPARKRPHA